MRLRSMVASGNTGAGACTILSARVEKAEVGSFYCGLGVVLPNNKGHGCVSGPVAGPVETQSSNGSVWVEGG